MEFISNISLKSKSGSTCNVLYIEDIHSFAVNTKNIVIECNENISIFTSAKHEWKFECFHYARWNFLWYSLKKGTFSFHSIVHTPMRVSDVITNVTKQNMNITASTFSVLKHVKHWRDKSKRFRQIKIILIPNCSLHSNWENAYQHLIV